MHANIQQQKYFVALMVLGKQPVGEAMLPFAVIIVMKMAHNVPQVPIIVGPNIVMFKTSNQKTNARRFGRFYFTP
jgi:hypothetical protein